MLWRYLFFAVLLIAVQLMAAEGSSRHGVDKKHAPLKDPSSNETEVLNHGKPKNLFARRAHQRLQRPVALQHAAKKPREPKQPSPPSDPPARRCPRPMESCTSHKPCCDPCAICRCRFFNSVCYCWRPGRHCQKKS
ncbi:hypothetical protein ANANG_G00171510 [Anguilla anguilla]|uniref:Agouti domain-containing protein n=1 Tax=Anguilla anguilla TaxID=7936 RepID=A0A9D3M3I3_ANGAN|nr:hypothetical protein ANANG_G00171510 [Anguilla anguilla]